jgi:hypothetical protein
VDALSDDRGQALVLAVLALAIAAATIVGLRATQDRILADARERRAGEAAIEAAGAALADAQIELIAPGRAEIEALVTDPLVIERSRRAADALSAANHGPATTELVIGVGPRTIEIALSVGAHRQRAAIEISCCRR